VADLPPRLGARRDLCQLVSGDPGSGPAPEPGEVVALARHWRALPVLGDAIATSRQVLGLRSPNSLDNPNSPNSLNSPRAGGPAALADDLSARLAREPGPWSDRVLLAAHRRPGHVYWRQLAGVAVLRSWSDRLAYLRALAWPTSTYLRGRRWSLVDHARRAVRAVDAPIRHRVVQLGRRLGRRFGIRR
jgi:hypothetical protein